MRIIGGTLKGRSVKGPQHKGTRPILARIRKSLFDILRPKLNNTQFLDLFSGTGCVGIEAVSRGAQNVTFIEKDFKMCKQIETAIKQFNIETARVHCTDVFRFIKTYTQAFDIIFAGPPYYEYLGKKILEEISSSKLLNSDTIIVVQHFIKEDMPEEIGRCLRYRVERYGDTKMSFYRQGC